VINDTITTEDVNIAIQSSDSKHSTIDTSDYFYQYHFDQRKVIIKSRIIYNICLNLFKSIVKYIFGTISFLSVNKINSNIMPEG
jgi:hypothetical protein